MRFKPFKVEAWLDKYEPATAFHLGETSMAPLSTGELKDITHLDWKDVENIKLDYGEIQGSLPLREEVAKLYPNTDPSEVIITNGSIEANFLAIAALSEDLEIFLAEHPGYNQLYELPQAFGRKVKLHRLRKEESFSVDPERLIKEAEEAEGIILNHPHNPTGASLPEEKMSHIIEELTHKGKKILFDQVYLMLSRGEPITPPARKYSTEAIITGGLSKTFGLPGLRIGWIVGPKEFIEKCWKIRDYLAISVSPITQYLAYLALREKESILERNKKILRRNFEIISNWIKEHNDIVDWVPPSEGCVGFPWFKSGVNSEEICRALMVEKGVLLVPGTCFELPEHFRIGFGFDTEILVKGLKKIDEFFKEGSLK